jgi:[acyl-carrier-protein] S-malonyltransferase
MKKAFVFPGQGSQHVGMGVELSQAFASARDVFEEINEALSQNLSGLMFEGPEEELTLTENAQPALMAVSMAVVRVLEKDFGVKLAEKVSFVAGHSLGEYSALAAAGTFSIADTARLLKTRGQAMQAAVPVGKGAMAALLGLDVETARTVAESAAGGEVCDLANDNSEGQIVVSGDKAAVERALDIAKEHGAKRAVLLPVSAPFHCSLMAPAADVMQDALSGVDMHTPAVPLVANVTASQVEDTALIKSQLVAQVTGMVRWSESVLYMGEQGVGELYECGAGKVLTGLTRRINRDISSMPVGTPDDIEAAATALS